MFQFSIVFISVVFFIGCSPLTNLTKQNQEPKWLLDPYIDGDEIAAVGCAKTHFKGIEAQKDLAISRAINRIAIQNSVIVDNITYRQKNNSNDKKRSTSISATSSLHTVEKTKISTKTKAIYTKIDGEICAWVVQK